MSDIRRRGAERSTPCARQRRPSRGLRVAQARVGHALAVRPAAGRRARSGAPAAGPGAPARTSSRSREDRSERARRTPRHSCRDSAASRANRRRSRRMYQCQGRSVADQPEVHRDPRSQHTRRIAPCVFGPSTTGTTTQMPTIICRRLRPIAWPWWASSDRVAARTGIARSARAQPSPHPRRPVRSRRGAPSCARSQLRRTEHLAVHARANASGTRAARRRASSRSDGRRGCGGRLRSGRSSRFRSGLRLDPLEARPRRQAIGRNLRR